MASLLSSLQGPEVMNYMCVVCDLCSGCAAIKQRAYAIFCPGVRTSYEGPCDQSGRPLGPLLVSPRGSAGWWWLKAVRASLVNVSHPLNLHSLAKE